LIVLVVEKMNEQFNHEKPDVHQLELKFLSWVSELWVEVRENTKRQGEMSTEW